MNITTEVNKNHAILRVDIEDVLYRKFEQLENKVRSLERHIKEIELKKTFYKDRFEKINLIVSRDQEARKVAERELERALTEVKIYKKQTIDMQEEVDKYKFLTFELKALIRSKDDRL